MEILVGFLAVCVVILIMYIIGYIYDPYGNFWETLEAGSLIFATIALCAIVIALFVILCKLLGAIIL